MDGKPAVENIRDSRGTLARAGSARVPQAEGRRQEEGSEQSKLALQLHRSPSRRVARCESRRRRRRVCMYATTRAQSGLHTFQSSVAGTFFPRQLRAVSTLRSSLRSASSFTVVEVGLAVHGLRLQLTWRPWAGRWLTVYPYDTVSVLYICNPCPIEEEWGIHIAAKHHCLLGRHVYPRRARLCLTCRCTLVSPASYFRVRVCVCAFCVAMWIYMYVYACHADSPASVWCLGR